MSLITSKCQTIPGLISFAKTTKEVVRQAGESFYFAPVGCGEDQVDGLHAKGFRTIILRDGREGLCWRKGRR